MFDSILRALVVARQITIAHRSAFPAPRPLPGIYLNQRYFKEPNKNLLFHFREMHGNDIELLHFPQARIADGEYDVKVPPGGLIIEAFVENYHGSEHPSKVWVSDALNYCHQRFYALKELIHLLTNSDDNVTVSIEDIEHLLDSLVNASTNNETNDTHTPACKAENAAFFGALEVLLPKEAVNEFLLENAGMPADESSEILSKFYCLPRKAVNFRLRNHEFFLRLYAHPDFAEIAQHEAAVV